MALSRSLGLKSLVSESRGLYGTGFLRDEPQLAGSGLSVSTSLRLTAELNGPVITDPGEVELTNTCRSGGSSWSVANRLEVCFICASAKLEIVPSNHSVVLDQSLRDVVKLKGLLGDALVDIEFVETELVGIGLYVSASLRSILLFLRLLRFRQLNRSSVCGSYGGGFSSFSGPAVASIMTKFLEYRDAMTVMSDW